MAESNTSAQTGSNTKILSATYQSPTNVSFVHTYKIPSPASSNPKDRSTQLNSIRKAAAQMQEDINRELTARMQDDNARGKEGGSDAAKASFVDEKKEEDFYGEEVVEED